MTKRDYRTFVTVGFLLIFGLLFLARGTQGQQFTGYQTYHQMTTNLKKLVNANKDLAKMESIGQTVKGRDIWLVTLADRRGTPLQERPGLFLAANFEGDHLLGSQLSLLVIEYLIKNYPTDQSVKKALTESVVYVIPRVNPDAAEAMFGKVKIGRKTNTTPFDDDNDGLVDEDGPEDLNHDGLITVMRVRDTSGNYMIDPDEPRLLKKADPTKGESGSFKIYWEGIDNDGDGFINEDPPGGVDLNRNFQHEYPYYQKGAGRFMVSEKESRALMDWIIAHRNVAIVLTFGESDNLIVSTDSKGQFSSDNQIDLFRFADESNAEANKTGMFQTARQRFGRFDFMRFMRMRQAQQQPSSRRRRPSRKPQKNVNKEDIEFFQTISKKYREITRLKVQPPVRPPRGTFFQYAYFQYGVPAFSTPGWDISIPGDTARHGPPTRGGQGMMQRIRRKGGRPIPGTGGNRSPKAGIDKTLLKWMDKNKVNGFIPWQPFHHPDLGEVEIGGFCPYKTVNPPEEKIAELAENHGKFVIYLTSLFPRVKIARTEVTNHGGGLFRIKAEVENRGFLPTSLKHGEVSRSVKPTMVQLEIQPDRIISGDQKTNFFQILAGSGNRKKYEWIIKGKAGDKIELKVVSQKGGSDHKVITLK